MSELVPSRQDNINSVADDLVKSMGTMDALHQLAMMSGYKEKVPDIDTFIDDPYYLGEVIGGLDSENRPRLYPIWRAAARELYPTPYHTSATEVYLTGGIGLGKSTAAILITLYDLCKLLSLENPHHYYGLIESTVIEFALMNATQSLAYGVLYAQLVDWLEASPYFKSKMNKKHEGRTLFKGNINISSGSRGSDMLGKATIGAIFSEINDMTKVKGQAEDNFDTIYTRMVSRFGGKGKELIGHLLLDSSNKGNKSFIDVRLEDKEKKGVRDYKLFRFAHWESKWHLGAYSGEMFEVFAGDMERDPFIIEFEEQKIGLTVSRIIKVPVEHRDVFEFNIIKSLRDLAGVSTFGIISFISSSQAITHTFSQYNPVSKTEIVLDFFNRAQKLYDYLDLGPLTTNKKPRYIHIDLGLKHDKTGIASSYIDRFEVQTSFDQLTGEEVQIRQPIFVTEFVMCVSALPGHEVAIYKIKEMILFLKRIGYNIARVSTDGYQSTNLRQDLTLMGIQSDLVSCDRTKQPYHLLRDLVLEDRLQAPYHPRLVDEIKNLEENDKMVDHPSTSSKDLADAVVGSIFNCSQNIEEDLAYVDHDMVNDVIGALADASEDSLYDRIMTGFQQGN